MGRTLRRAAPWISVVGVVVLLIGISIDAGIHRRNPGLAAVETVLAPGNPGHALIALGVALLVIGSTLFLVGLAVGASDARRTWRTPIRFTVGFAAAAGLMLLSLSTLGAAAQSHPSSGRPDGEAPPHSHGISGPTPSSPDLGPPTDHHTTAARKLLSDTVVGISRFVDFEVAQAERYRQTTRYWNGVSGPAHFTNLAYNRDGRILDPARPENLVYLRTRSGEMRLLGAMYTAPKGQGPAVGGSLTPWHVHHNWCFGPNGVAAPTGPRACPAGTVFVGDAIEMLHVWTFDNPDGPFADHLTLKAIIAAAR